MATTAVTPGEPNGATSQERFFKQFQHEVTNLQQHMYALEHQGSPVPEQTDAIDHCLAGIAKLSDEVKDASSYLPAYDQRTYSEAIKALSEKLQGIRATVAPRPKFAFKKKNPSAISINDAAELASEQRRRMPGYTTDTSTDSSFASTPADPRSPAPGLVPGVEISRPVHLTTDSATTLDPSSNQASSVTISNHRGVHIILPSSSAHATMSGTLSNLRGCVVDMSTSMAQGQTAFAGLTLRNIRDSLIICGRVGGAAHMTDVKNSVVVVSSRQFRMHESSHVDVYLHCGSRPIIEDCEGVSFAPLPEYYMTDADRQTENQWKHVDDFKWLKIEPSPNWGVLDLPHRVREEVWTGFVPGGANIGPSDILKAVKLSQA